MSTVREILKFKGSKVYTISEGANVLEASLLMNDHKIGALSW